MLNDVTHHLSPDPQVTPDKSRDICLRAFEDLANQLPSSNWIHWILRLIFSIWQLWNSKNPPVQLSSLSLFLFYCSWLSKSLWRILYTNCAGQQTYLAICLFRVNVICLRHICQEEARNETKTNGIEFSLTHIQIKVTAGKD